MCTLMIRQYTRWLWLLLPLIIVIVFNKLVVSSLTLWHQISGGIPPGVFFLLPFISVIPPIFLLVIWHLGSNRNLDTRLPIYNQGMVASDIRIGSMAGLLCIFAFILSLKMLRTLGLGLPNLTSLTFTHHLFFSTIGALIPGISEELYFRGFLTDRFRDLPPSLLILSTSISFSLWHILSPLYLLHTFVLGLILGFTVYKTHRILPAIIAHSLANAIAGVILVRGWL